MVRSESTPASGIKTIQRGQQLIAPSSTAGTHVVNITITEVDLNNAVLYCNTSWDSAGGIHSWQSTHYFLSTFSKPEVQLTTSTNIEVDMYQGPTNGPGGNGRDPYVSWQVVEYY
jgi:hypothetical protein